MTVGPFEAKEPWLSTPGSWLVMMAPVTASPDGNGTLAIV